MGRRALELGVVGLLSLVVVGGALGQPVVLSYVATDSMEPALSPGDGFIALPTAVVDDPEAGDVVVYRAQTGQHAGDLVTHRVVERTPQGYVTRGDANPFTDQGAGEPPVPESRLVAIALQVDGHVVVLPGVGDALLAAGDAADATSDAVGVESGPGGAGLLVFGVGAILYALSLGGETGRSRGRDRARSRERVVSAEQVVLGIALLVVLPATATMVAPAGAHSFSVVSSDANSVRGSAIPAGEEATRELDLRNPGTLPVAVFMEPTSEGVRFEEGRHVIGGGGVANATVTLSAPEQTGYYVRTAQEHRYLLVLPMPVVAALYDLHPWLPIIAIDAILASGFGLLALAALGRTQIRIRSRSRRTKR